jgi:hypothetical protein
VILDGLTWDAILEQWPFAAAALVFVIAVVLFIVVKPRSKQKPEVTDAGADKRGWVLTERIDFADSHVIGKLVLEVEETRSVVGWTGVEHCEIRWRKATVDEAKMVLESYNAQRNLAMSAIFAVNAHTGTKPGGQRIDGELEDADNGKDSADVTLVPQAVTR